MNNNQLALTHMSLERKTSERKSIEWLTLQLNQSATQFIPIWQGEYFFADNELLQLTTAQLDYPIELLIGCCYLLGIDDLNDSAVLLLDLSLVLDEQAQALALLAAHFQLAEDTIKHTGFRWQVPLLDKALAANLAYGRSLALWHQSARYCGYCGGETHSIEAGHCRECHQCQHQFFPRTDPVVIMLVEYQASDQPNRCLLAGHHRTPGNLVSTLAGFVDPGESLEQAVRREVFEEAGIQVGDVEYIASQPWPFPHSIMIGFFAKAITKDICIDAEEISHAQWFDAKQVAQFSDWGDDDDNIQIPKKESIARHLIELWLSKNKEM
ncbi:hypothetical protein tinsulaeT_33480 [Thalassotalea insulae]|uniref:NAD(+) diphosphatase n=1 Tax=Thalassotalea insulae TaxID=2056778 RepID=A0ABQ6GVT1_9GAMM|nr:NAD(+) diphosphatase [Thalassotalea insulae]GLX80008.1 hypothetical protein tinsulaeT_33480 [Thalassotalea insulae]